MNLSVLQHATKADVRLEPFPHLIIQDALDSGLCDRLVHDYPSLDLLGVDPKKNNVRWSYSTARARNNNGIPSLWRELLNYHSSQKFCDEVLGLFADAIIQTHPSFFPREEILRNLRPGIREIDSFEDRDILLDAQICGNTPVSTPRSVKLNHVDSPQKLFAGLYYLRRDNDDSIGGDLEIRCFKPGYTARQKANSYDGVYVSDQHTQLIETVRYRKNTLVILINSLESFHGVTVRQPTPHNRLFMNLLGEVNAPLFNVPRTFKTRVKKLQRLARKRIYKVIGREYTQAYHDGY